MEWWSSEEKKGKSPEGFSVLSSLLSIGEHNFAFFSLQFRRCFTSLNFSAHISIKTIPRLKQWRRWRPTTFTAQPPHAKMYIYFHMWTLLAFLSCRSCDAVFFLLRHHRHHHHHHMWDVSWKDGNFSPLFAIAATTITAERRRKKMSRKTRLRGKMRGSFFCERISVGGLADDWSGIRVVRGWKKFLAISILARLTLSTSSIAYECSGKCSSHRRGPCCCFFDMRSYVV